MNLSACTTSITVSIYVASQNTPSKVSDCEKNASTISSTTGDKIVDISLKGKSKVFGK